MAAAELLDFNQVQEQSPSTGDQPSTSGGLLTWNFRADPNLAIDLSQSFFVMEIAIRSYVNGLDAANNGTTAPTGWKKTYVPDFRDFHAFFPLRLFTAMSHIIDGVTVAHTNQPWADKIMQEKYLKDTSLSNLGNFESVNLARSIDDYDPNHNIFMAQGGKDLGEVGGNLAITNARANRARIHDISSDKETYTIMFQPPFDMWTKHQRISGGNHQIQLNLKAASGQRDTADGESNTLWGKEVFSPEAGLNAYLYSESLRAGVANHADVDFGPITGTVTGGETFASTKHVPESLGEWGTHFNNAGGATETSGKVRNAVWNQYYRTSGGSYVCPQVDIKSIRLMRRMVRFTVERPIGMEEFNTTEMAFFHGTSTSSQQTQNFLLPASTFAIGFYWRSATDPSYNVVDGNREMSFASDYTGSLNGKKVGFFSPQLRLDQFYFTYGGETYPSQRINEIWGGTDANGPGAIKLQALTHMLQGVMNTDMDRYNVNYSGEGLLDRLDASSFLFPVSKHNNSDNSDLQVFFKCDTPTSVFYGANGASTEDNKTLSVSLVCVAFYDARVELAYNAANQLEKVTKTEWK